MSTGNSSGIPPVGTVTGALAQLQSDLAKINLQKIRGEYTAAKAACLRVLKQYPQSVEAHVMIGDIHLELKQYPEAVEWYNLALDLDKNSPQILAKLRQAQASLKKADPIIVEPANHRNLAAISGVVVVSTVAIASIAYVASTSSKNQKSPTIVEKITAPAPVQSVGQPITKSVNLATNSAANDFGQMQMKSTPRITADSSPSVPSNPKVSKDDPKLLSAYSDRVLLEQISAKTVLADHLVDIQEDPRSNSLTVTYAVTKKDHGRFVGACLALAALQYEMKFQSVILRGIRDGQLAYIADVNRAKVMEAENKYGKPLLELNDPNWIDDVLENEYKSSDRFSSR